MVTIDRICKSVLIQRNKPIHWYIQFLLSARDCYRELLFDDLKIINTATIKFDSFNEGCLPKDCGDVINVGYGIGQNVRNLVPDSSLNSLINYDDYGNRTSYINNNSVANPRDNYLIGYEGYIPYYSSDYWGAYSGVWFGYNGGYSDTYKVIAERKVIKINENLVSDGQNWSIQYIGDGSCINAGTLVDPYSINTINAYIDWWKDYGGKAETPGERKYLWERKILRARKSDLTLPGIKRAMDESYSLVPKN